MPHSKRHAQLTELPPEVQLLILASRLELAVEDARLFQHLLESGPDWTKVLADAKQMGVQPLLYKHLVAPERRSLVPAEALETLEKAYRKAAFRSLRTQGQLQQLVEQAEASGIPLLLLKGAALSRWIYGDPALRPMNDMDVLCRPKDVPALQDVLHAQGYRARPLPVYSALHAAVGREKSHLPPYDHPKGVCLEVHLNLFGNEEKESRAVIDSVWECARDVRRGGIHFLTLSKEHMLLHLCLHIHKHVVSGKIVLYWFCDVFEFVKRKRDELDWQAFWFIARRLEAEEKAGLIFDILHIGWGLPLPPYTAMPTEGIANLDMIFDPACAARARLLHFLPGRAHLLRDVAARYGLAASIGYGLRILFPTGDYVQARYQPETRTQFLGCYVRHVAERLQRTIVSVCLQIFR